MATVAGLRQSQRVFKQCGKRKLDSVTEVQDKIQRLAKIHRDRRQGKKKGNTGSVLRHLMESLCFNQYESFQEFIFNRKAENIPNMLAL